MPIAPPPVAESSRTRLVGFHDLQGRESLQVAPQGDWCYVGHMPGNRRNPLTGKSEDNGTSILDVSNPAKPTLVAHIPGAPDANCRAVQVVKNPHDGKLTSATAPGPGCTSSNTWVDPKTAIKRKERRET